MPFNDIEELFTTIDGITVSRAYGSGAIVVDAIVTDGYTSWLASVTYYGREDETNEEWNNYCLESYRDHLKDLGADTEINADKFLNDEEE